MGTGKALPPNSETMRRHTFDLAQLEPFEIGAALTIIMCWPAPRDEELRGDKHTRLAAVLLRLSAGSDEQARITPRPMKSIYAFRNVEEDVENMKRLDNRLSEVLAFGHRLIPFLKHAYNGSTELLPGMDKLNLAGVVRAVEHETGNPVDPANFRKRDWLPWLPVAHLAAAARILLQQLEQEQAAPRPWWELMIDPAMIGRWLREAKLLEPIVLKAFPKVSTKLARIELAGVSLPPTN